jgi:hypothetical protein
MIESISREDRIWIVEQLVRRAPEFGVCRDLGANIYNYFIMQNGREDKELNEIFTKEIASSRVRPLFEYSIRLLLGFEDARIPGWKKIVVVAGNCRSNP